MNIEILGGTYVVAVSGGVDSMVLLNVLQKRPEIQLVVAHFDHGIRADSADDRKFVEKAAKEAGLIFEYGEGQLGPSPSEEQARNARYAFLAKVREKYTAAAIITAHHQDDLIETALINLLRGTGRKGLSSLRSKESLLRPLLAYKKSDIIEYAQANKLEWQEDSTNTHTDYLRNYLRLHIIPKLKPQDRSKLVMTLEDITMINNDIDKEIAKLLQNTDENKQIVSKKLIINLTHNLACEVVAEWLRRNGIREFDRKGIERLVVAAKTLKPGQRTDINKQKYLAIEAETLVISS